MRTTLKLAAGPLLVLLGGSTFAAPPPPGDPPAAAAPEASAPSADELVRALEKVMYPDAKTTITLHFKSQSGRNEDYEMSCYTRERNQKIIVRITAPAAQVGNDILMMDENVWTYDKASSRVMKVASNQSFGGTGFSYGDVVRLNFSDNYSAVLKGESSDAYQLELTAKSRSAPYYQIALTVAKKGSWPVKGTYYARSGSVVKEVAYSSIKDAGAGMKPLVLTVSSPLDPGSINVMTVLREEPKELPDRIFNKRNLETRMEEKL